MAVFWKNGYANTSIRDVVQVTGVARAGIYAAFGDKDGVFEAALNRYVNQILGANFARLETESSGRKDIESLFRDAVVAFKAGVLKNGCFIANSAVEFAGISGPVARLVKRVFKREVKAFENALGNAMKNEEISSRVEITACAHSMATTFFGMSALARIGAPNEAIEDAAAMALKQMDR